MCARARVAPLCEQQIGSRRVCGCSKYVVTLVCLCVFYLGEGGGGITIAMGTQVL